MRKLLLMLFVNLLFASGVSAQSMSGQWTGGFASSNDMWGGRTEYVLELEVKGDEVEGHSYTYFSINGKRCYVICKLKGVYDKGSRSIEVTEVAKVKSNTPPDFRDCLQTHELTFFKQGDREVLKGRWKSATVKDNCGTGSTELERKALVKVTPVQPPAKDIAENKTEPKKAEEKPSTVKSAPSKTNSNPPKKNPVSPPVVKKTTPPANKTKTTTTSKQPEKKVIASSPKTKKDSAAKVEQPIALDNHRQTEEEKPKTIKMPSYSGKDKLEARNKNIIKTIEVQEVEFTVNLYDNGQVDGDTVTLYYNGKLIASKQRLSTSPINIKIKIEPGKNDNDLVMIAENLGSIPPNTALMVVTVGDKRYEVNITSTEQTNGTVRFRLKE